jgi:hypothetical protein
LVMGLYELLGNPTTKLIEPPRPPLYIDVYHGFHNLCGALSYLCLLSLS